MTVEVQTRRNGYTTSGSSSGPFSISFPFYEIDAYLDGELINPTDYQITGGNGHTGSITFYENPDAGNLVIYGATAAKQEIDYIGQDDVAPNQVEFGLDRLTMAVQELQNTLKQDLVVTPQIERLSEEQLNTVATKAYVDVVFDSHTASIDALNSALPASVRDYNPMGYGAAGDGTTSDTIAFNAARDAAIANGSRLVISKPHSIMTNTTVTCPIEFRTGGKLIPGSGVTITLSGGITAPVRQHIFDVSEGGTFSGQGPLQGNRVYIDWWGAVGNSNSAFADNNDAALTAAVAFLKQRSYGSRTGGVLQYGMGGYVHSTGAYIDFPGCQVRGYGNQSTVIYVNDQSITMFYFEGSVTDGSKAAYGCGISDLTIQSVAAKPTTGTFIMFDKCQECYCDNNWFLNPYIAVTFYECSGPLTKSVDRNNFVAPSTLPSIAGSTLIFIQGNPTPSGGATGLCENVYITRNNGGGIGINYGVRLTGFDTVMLTHNHLHGASGAQLAVDANYGCNCYNLRSTANCWEALITYGSYAVYLSSSGGVICNSFQFTGDQVLNGTSGVFVVDGDELNGVTINGCHIQGAINTAVKLLAGSNIKLVNCEFNDGDVSASGSASWVTIGESGGAGPTTVMISQNTMSNQYIGNTLSRGINILGGTKIRVDDNVISDATTPIRAEIAADDYWIGLNDCGVRSHAIIAGETLSVPLSAHRVHLSGALDVGSIDDTGTGGNSAFDGRVVEFYVVNGMLFKHDDGNLALRSAANTAVAAGACIRFMYDHDLGVWVQT